jgi:ribonuclease P protein subunit POP4
MSITPEIICSELIGTNVKITKSINPNYIGIYGKVIDETKKTFSISSEGKTKIIVKGISVFHFSLSDGTIVEIDGRLLIGRPEDRLKKSIKRLW